MSVQLASWQDSWEEPKVVFAERVGVVRTEGFSGGETPKGAKWKDPRSLHLLLSPQDP